MAEVDKSKKSGGSQAGDKPKKLLKNGLDPSIGKSTQFKPGQSGNPAGPKPGYKHISTWIQELTSDPDFEAKLFDMSTLSLVDYKGAPLKAIIMSAVTIALTASKPTDRMAAAEWIAKHGWKQQIDITSDDKPIPLLAGLAPDKLEVDDGGPAQADDSADKDQQS